MESLVSRYRNLLVLLALLAAQILGLAMQVHRTETGRNVYDTRDSSGVRLIRLWANAAVTPPERLIQACKLGLENLWADYISSIAAHKENVELKATLDRMRLEQAMLLEDAKQGQRLQAQLKFQEKYIYSTTTAQIVGASGSETSRIYTLDKGSADGLAHDMAVITPAGIVGKIREVFPHSAQVLAINDQSFGAGVILESTRLRGILRGNAAGQPQIVGILSDQRIQPGERVLTAGGDAVFPRGLPVGVVEKVLRDPERDAFILVRIKPAAPLNQLDEVLVITSTEPRFAPQLAQDIADSEALKGAEAAAANEKKKNAAIMAERLPGLTDPNHPTDAQGQPVLPPDLNLRPQPPLHPDRFSPSVVESTEPAKSKSDSAAKTGAAAKPDADAKSTSAAKPAKEKSAASAPAAKPVVKPAPKRRDAEE
jgi:rod shape-determining protein MreC